MDGRDPLSEVRFIIATALSEGEPVPNPVVLEPALFDRLKDMPEAARLADYDEVTNTWSVHGTTVARGTP